jgi:hypothetical protein
MGSYVIEIRGTGQHHNSNHERDANELAAELVTALKEAGHTGVEGTFTITGAVDVL